ncbi:MAG: universal stress protein [Dehalococcoidia bacterium]|nr:universal stress protein [Dehalococcoidia bacterium]HRC63362.1 universal stress protein [Dehalococcoidia bacterium]
MRILVAVDASEQAERVVAAAAGLLRNVKDPEIRLLTVVDDADIHESTATTLPQGTPTPLGSWSGSSYNIPTPSSPHLMEDRSQALTRIHGELQSRDATLAAHHLPGQTIESRVVSGSKPAPAILEAAKEFDAELIVMGTRGRRGISRILMGSTAEAIVRESPIPVVVIGDAVKAAS